MNKNLLMFKMLVPLVFLVLYNNVYSQKTLKLINISKPEKSITFREGNLISLKYAEVLIEPVKLRGGEKLQFKRISGRIREINDSTITIKKLFSKKSPCIELVHIYQIRKEPAEKFILMGMITGGVLGLGLFVYDVPMHLILLGTLPPLLLINYVFPYKKINEEFFIVHEPDQKKTR